MSILSCPEGTQLIDNLAEAMLRQFELPSQTRSACEIALEMETAEDIQEATRHAADHLMRCPICRTH
jgi:hypothetical protein